MAEAHDRKGFFKALLRGAASTAQEVTQAFQEAATFDEPGGQGDPYGIQFGGGIDQRAVPVEGVTRTATEDDLRRLAAEHGLGARVDDVLAHARPSVRLVRAGTPGRSRLGGAPDLPPAFDWPSWRDERLAFVAQIDLEEAGLREGPSRGTLLVFTSLDARPTGLQPGDRGSTRVVLVDGPLSPAGDGASLTEVPLACSVELTLPSELAGFPPSLDLDPNELDGWQRLREELAALQGVEPEDRAVEWHALHRLGGWPDSTEEGMEVDAQLVANGVDLNSGERYYDPRVPDLERDAAQWRLLLQLSTDDDAGLTLGYPLGRLYVWIRDEDLRHGRFDDVWAFVR